jgi:peptidase E
MFLPAYDLRRTIVPDHSNGREAAFDRSPNLLRKPTTLIAGKFGSRHFGTKPYLADAVRLTGRDKPVALYIGVASGDDRNFGSALEGLLKGAGIRKVLWPKLSKRKKTDATAARAALDEADLVFVGGGDVEAGINTLHEAELVDDLHGAAKRGVVFVGMSAGAIMLGERWIRWPREGAGDDEAETFKCLGVAPCSLDTHGEGDGWGETQSFAAVRARELGKKARAYGVPSGAALVIGTDGTFSARGDAVTVFAALPNRKAKIEKQLEVDE